METPLILEEVEAGLGDILLLHRNEDGSYRFQEIIERPFRHFFRLIPGEYGYSRAFLDFGEWIVAHGGRWETMMGGVLLLPFPRGTRVPKVKAELRAHLERFEHSDERAELIKAGPFHPACQPLADRDHPSRRDK